MDPRYKAYREAEAEVGRLDHDPSVLRVMTKRCNECLYSNNRIISDERASALLAHCAETESHFICHKASSSGVDVMCRGHWDETKNETLRNRLAQELDRVRYIDEDALVIWRINRR